MPQFPPAESAYLIAPYYVRGHDLLFFTMQNLCLRKVLRAEYRMLRIDRTTERKTAKLFVCRGENFRRFSSRYPSELLVIKLFQKFEELRFYQVRQYFMQQLKGDTDRYRKQFVYPLLKKDRYCYLRFFLTNRGKRFKKDVKKQLDLLNEEVEEMMESDLKALLTRLEVLGGNMFLLDTKTIDRLKPLANNMQKLELLGFKLDYESAFALRKRVMESGGSEVNFGDALFGSSWPKEWYEPKNRD